MKTKCDGCVFLDKPKDTELFFPELNRYCKLDKIELYQEKNIKISRDNNGFPVIHNTVCPFKRDKKWPYSHLTREDIEDQIINENGFPFSCFIYENENIDINLAVNELINLSYVPQYIHITFKYMHQDNDLLVELNDKLSQHKIKHKLVINLDEHLDHFYESFLTFMLNVTTPFIAIYFKHVKLDSNFPKEIAEKIQKELLSFPYANTFSNEFILFPTSIVTEYLQETGPLFIEKILETQCQNYKL